MNCNTKFISMCTAWCTEEDTPHTLLQCNETRSMRKELPCKKRVVINQDLLLRTTRSCADKTYLNDTDTYLLKVKRKWGERMRNDELNGGYNSRQVNKDCVFSLKRPDRLWGPPSLAFSGNCMFCDDFQNFTPVLI